MQARVVGKLDLPYGGELGFRHAIVEAAAIIGQAKLASERALLQKLFDSVARDTNLYCFGCADVEHALVHQRAVHTVIVVADNPLVRWSLTRSGEDKVVYLPPGVTPHQLSGDDRDSRSGSDVDDVKDPEAKAVSGTCY